jgi:nucleotide-binding universal stress UspA family protein
VFQRILLAWDGSDVARRAFDVALDLARRTEGDLTALSIAYSPAHAETRADREESAEAARRFLQETFAKVADRAERAGLPVDHVIVEGDPPADVLLDYAHEHGFDLLVCGHHPSSRAGRLLLHGVAEQLVARTSIPVLVIGERER